MSSSSSPSISHSISLSFSHTTFTTTLLIKIADIQLNVSISDSNKFLELIHENTLYVESIDVFGKTAKKLANHERIELFNLENEAFGNLDVEELAKVFTEIQQEIEKVLECMF
jgi:hypothetical protein